MEKFAESKTKQKRHYECGMFADYVMLECRMKTKKNISQSLSCLLKVFTCRRSAFDCYITFTSMYVDARTFCKEEHE